MNPRWRILPHRIGGPEGPCRDCGRYESYSAPEGCTRCAVERFKDAGFHIMADPVAAFEVMGRERWRVVAQQLRSGQIRSGHFYVFVGHNDGGPLERPPAEVFPAGQAGELAFAKDAYDTGLGLVERYPQVWIVTTVGCWSVSSGMEP